MLTLTLSLSLTLTLNPNPNPNPNPNRPLAPRAPSQHWESLCTLVQRGGFGDEGDSPIQSTQPEQVESTRPELSALALASSATVVGVAVAMALVS